MMHEGSGELVSVPPFSPSAQEVHDAICRVQTGDERIQLFAKRFARAVTAFDAGAMSRPGPLAKFLLCGTRFSPIPLLVNTAAHSWLGEPWDQSPPFITVDCSAFHAMNPAALASLIGPSNLTGGSLPLFATIERPHLYARRPDEMRLFQAYLEIFNKRIGSRRSDLSRGMGFEVLHMKASELFSDAYTALLEEEKDERGPFGSVIFFDNVDKAPPSLRDHIMLILNTGRLSLPAGSVVDFSHSIVILGLYRDASLLKGENSLGFYQKRSEERASQNALCDSYQGIRLKLLEDAESGSFVQGVAENLIIVGERTRQSQEQRIRDELERIAAQSKELGVAVSYSGEFIERFLEDTKERSATGRDEERHIYTEERVLSGIDRNVLDPLHRLIFFGKLNRGASLRFEPISGHSFEPEIILTEMGGDEKLMPGDIRASASEASGSVPQKYSSSDDWPTWFNELHSQTSALLGT